MQAASEAGRDDRQVARQQRYLLVFSGSSSWMYRLPARGDVVIGRSEAADLRIDLDGVSSLHVHLMLDDDAASLRDLGSVEGTYVNKRKVIGEYALYHGDVIALNDTTLVFHAVPSSTASVETEKDQGS